MKVLFVVSTLRRSGPINILYNLLKYLDKTNMTPVILTLSGETEGSRINDFKKLGINIYSLELTRLKTFIYGPIKFNKVLKQIKPDIIHTSGFRADLMIGFSVRKIKKVSTLHNYPFEDYVMTYGKTIGNTMAWLTIFAYSKFDSLITCSNFVKDRIYTKTKLDLKVIHNGIDTEDFYPPTFVQKKKAKEELSLSEEVKTFIFIGNLTYRKDPQTTLDAFCKVFSLEQAELLILGDGDLFNNLNNQYKCYKNIRFLGHVTNTYPYLKAADYYIASSLSEGFPTSVMEALGTGLPVILSNIEPHIEMWKINNKAGQIFSVKNIEELSSKLLAILKEDYELMSQSSIDIIKNHLTAKLMSEKYRNLYFEIISK